MNTSFRWLALLPLLLSSAIAQEPSSKVQSPLILTHVTVIDATGAPAQRDMTVIISNGRISKISKGSDVRPTHDSRLIDASGEFLIPGLWDMHVHWTRTEYLPLFLANGVTGMRIMWGNAQHHEWRSQVEAGRLLAPHMVIASAIVDGPKPFWPGSIAVSTEAQARQAVAEVKQAAADFVKVYSYLPRAEYFAIADEAKKQGIPFAGHVPLDVSAEEASNSGQKSFEHLIGILPATSTRSDDIIQANRFDLADEMVAEHPSFPGQHAKMLRQVELDTYSTEKAATLFALLKKNGTWQVPTLTALRSIAYSDDSSFTHDPRVKYMPPSLRRQWTSPDVANLYGPHTAEDFAFAKKEFAKDLQLVGDMQKAGVGVLAGTDALNPFCMPGFSLHDELALLVKAGLTPMQALQAATLNPARFLGSEKDFGTIEEGKVADLLLLDANPLDDIANTKKINAVVYGGRLLTRSELDKMLSDVEATAARQPIGEILMKTIQEKDVAAAVQQYRYLKATQPGGYDFSENELNGLGYNLLRVKKMSDAIEIFKLSVEVYPQSYNTWDSLAEAYMKHGDKELAIQNYRKSLELNSENTNAIEKLKQLSAP
jgi:imidazolonepropionase-like amidohydrolase